MIGIYKITNPIGQIYVGQSKNIKKRWKQYYCLSIRNQKKLYDSFLTYGLTNHKFEVIEECFTDDLLKRESYWQKKLKCFTDGLNLNNKNNYVMINDVIEPNNERNAGRKPKFTKGGKMVSLQRRVPEKGLKQISEAVDKAINQFIDYDWT